MLSDRFVTAIMLRQYALSGPVRRIALLSQAAGRIAPVIDDGGGGAP